MRLLVASTIIFLGLTVAPAVADTVHWSCNIAKLVQREDGFKVTCSNGYSYTDPLDGNVTITQFVPTGSGRPGHWVELSESRMAAFQAMAILAYEQEKPLLITFEQGGAFGPYGPGVEGHPAGTYPYDCPKFACRPSYAWSVLR